MIEKDFFMDLELYLCENFGYRNCFSITETCNGCCVYVREKELDLYFRMWEYSKGVGGFPDWSIILVTANFSKNQELNLRSLINFFKEYAPNYGFKYIGIENERNLQEILNYKSTILGKHFPNYVVNIELA